MVVSARGGVERRPVERVRGTQDSWAPEAERLAAIRQRLEATFAAFGYRRVDVPVLEPAELHLRKSGLEIISKLYAFDDLGGRQLCLRPELTASVVRAVVAQPPVRLPARVYSTGPVFRYERPSRGRYRQFTQSGVELIGADTGPADAEIIHLAMHALDRLGVREYQVTLGHVGILGQLLTALGIGGRLRAFFVESLEEARRRGVAAVRRRLEDLDPELFEPESNGAVLAEAADGAQLRATVTGLLTQVGGEGLGRRREVDVVERLLEKLHPGRAGSKRQTVEQALTFLDRLSAIRGEPQAALAAGRALLADYGLDPAPLEDLRTTVALLEAFGADLARVQVDLGLGRGLQYYTGTVFEVDHAGLGSESQLCGGGRYDDLSRALGFRQALPALGFAFGVERLRLALEAEGRLTANSDGPEVFVVAAAPEQLGYAAQVAQRLREVGLRTQLEVTARPLRSALAYADREGIPRVVVVGEAEASAGTVQIRDMAGSKERTLPLADVAQLAGKASPVGEPHDAKEQRS